MRRPRISIRSMLLLVFLAALLIWGGMMGKRSYDFYRLARDYESNERGWRSIAARRPWNEKFASECADYFALLSRKYRRAMWRPWLPVAPDPYAPGAREAEGKW